MSEVLIPHVMANLNGHDQVTTTISYEFNKNRVIYIYGEINNTKAMLVTSQLMYLNEKSDAPITVLINSPGGSVTDGMDIYDCMKYGVQCEIITFAKGMAASMGALLLAAGTKGKRFAAPNTQIMIHQPLGGVQGQATDISLVANHIQDTKKRLASILAEVCGKTRQKLMRDTERDMWMNSAQALEYGLIDHVGFPFAKQEVLYDY